MTHKPLARVVALLVGLALVALPAGILAQDSHQTYVLEGLLSFEYPAGWFLVDRGVFGLVMGTSDAAYQEGAIPTGEMGVITFTPFSTNLWIFGPDQDPHTTVYDAVQRMAEQFINENRRITPISAPVPLSIGGKPAARMAGSMDTGEAVVFALNINPGEFFGLVAYTAPGELALQEPTLMDILESVTYTPDWNAVLPGHYNGAFSTYTTLGVVNALALSPDGTLLASADGDGNVRLWGIPSE